jgi:hypothetical protein
MLKNFIFNSYYRPDGYYSSKEYTIVDDEFEETVKDEGLGVSVITVYEARNLPVVPNLVKAYLMFAERNHWSINDVIRNQRETNRKFVQYEEDVLRYLLLV